MQITDKEMRKVMEMGGNPASSPRLEVDLEAKAIDPSLVQAVVQDVLAMPDREDRVEELKAAIEAGEYNPTSMEIADAMVRRNIADRIR